jgi:hypothetical protein
LTQKLRTGSHAGVQFSLSKVSSVKLVVSRNGRAVWSNSATVEGGKPRLLWITPAKGGEYSVSLHAVDLAGNSATVEGKITLAH